MRDILIVVLVVALVVMVLGLANLDGHADVAYLFGTWQDASLLSLFAMASCLIVLVGVVAAGFAVLHARRDRRKLELELQQIYVRLRAAEAAVPSVAIEAVGVDAPDEVPENASREVREVTCAREAPETSAAESDTVEKPVG